MKIKVRHGVFETNSSSMHSICILNNSNKNNEDYSNHETFFLELKNYGRYPFQVLFTPEEKMSYCVCTFHSGKYDIESESFKKIKNKYLKMVQTHYPNIENIAMFGETSYKNFVHTKDGKEYDIESDEIYYSDTGHYCLCETKEELYPSEKRISFLEIGYNDGAGLLENFLKETGITEEKLIFNPKYFIVVDGDEYCIFHDMMNRGIIFNVKAEYCEYSSHNFGII